MGRESSSIATFVELADKLVNDYDVIDVLTALSHRCVEAVDVDAAAVMLASPAGELRFITTSSESMRDLEMFQNQSSEGACVDCIRNGQVTADRRHGEIARDRMVTGLIRDEPNLAPDLYFGVAALMMVENRFATHLLDARAANRSSLVPWGPTVV